MRFEGLLSSVDFEENEITIQVQGEIVISAGKYVVIDSESFESIATSRKELFEALQIYLNAGSKEQRREASIIAKKAIEKALK